jgi:hypothetical protein
MRGYRRAVAMKPMLVALVSTALILSLLATRALAKGENIGIFALIDQVTFDHEGPSRETVKISGVFLVPTPGSNNSWSAPQRGYLYFRVPGGAEVDARSEWTQLKAFAGKGKVIGFASWWVPNQNPSDVNHIPLEVTVWSDSSPKATPEPYPVANPDGIIKKPGKYHPNFKEIAAELMNYKRLHP